MKHMLVSINPSTGATVGEVPIATADDVRAAVAQARESQPAWADLGLAGRRQALERLGPALEAKAEEIGRLVTAEMGKPVKEAIGEVRSCADVAGELLEMEEALAPVVNEDEGTRTVIHHDPFGVCAAITPWNFPVSMPHWMVLPSLMAGNTVVLKPSEETPLSAQAYADVVAALLPRGVLQVVHGADGVGSALVDADVDLIAFTGSREVGKLIMKAAAGGLKRVILELGGKDPLIVLDDADVAAAAAFAARNCFRNAGQVCVSTERIYVMDSVAAAFREKLLAEAPKMKVGDGMDAATRVGPLVSERQKNHVLGQIDEAVAKGAKVLYGGSGHHGNFVMPTVLDGVRPDMAIARQETFGPVACITAVASEQEAVRLANGSPYGLGAVVFGAPDHAEAVGRKLQSGMIGINRGVGGVRAPWVGARESGYGFHGSPDGHRQFTQTRVVSRPKAAAGR